MLSGYEMTACELATALPQWAVQPENMEEWRFKAIEPVLKRESGQDLAHAELLKHLKASGARMGKIWQLSRPLVGAAIVLLAAAIGAGAAFAAQIGLLVPRIIMFGTIFYFAAAFVLWVFHRLLRTGKSLTVVLTGLLVVPLGALIAGIHLLVFDPLFLRKGAIGRPPRPQSAGRPTGLRNRRLQERAVED
jgi:hypothetical protein